MSLIGNGNTPKALIGCLSHPIDSNAPGIQLAMWLGQMKIFRTMLCTLCQNYYYIQYATMWLPLHAKVQYLHSGYQLLVNFMYFYCFRVFHREFPWPTGVNFNISYHRHQGLLECQTFMHYLMPVVQFISSSVEACPLWKCCYLCFTNYCFICFLCAYDIIIYYCHYYRDNGSHLLSHCTTRYMNYFTCDVKLTGFTGKTVQ